MSPSNSIRRVIPYYSRINRTTCYILAPALGNEAILVDPVHVDNAFYEILLNNDLVVRWVLVTHPEIYMRHALRTLCRIFRFGIVSGETDLFYSSSCERITPDGEKKIVLCGIPLQAIPFLPHSRSSFVFRIENLLFSGSIVHAGTLGETPGTYNDELLVAAVKDHIFSLPSADRDLLLLPSMGPPSTVRAEHHLTPIYRE